jgi:hypothetical protein
MAPQDGGVIAPRSGSVPIIGAPQRRRCQHVAGGSAHEPLWFERVEADVLIVSPDRLLPAYGAAGTLDRPAFLSRPTRSRLPEAMPAERFGVLVSA